MPARDRNGQTVVLVGGAALLALLFSRGRGWGFRTSGDGERVGGRQNTRRTVWIRADRIEVDGTLADLPTVLAKAREAGAVEVRATGDAVTRVVREVLAALSATGVTIYTPPDIRYIVPSEPIR